MKTLKERIAVEQAYLDGGAVDWKYNGGGGWFKLGSLDKEYVFNWRDHDYRVKPEPLEFYINVFDKADGAYMYETREAAAKGASMTPLKVIKVREVTDDNT